VPKVCFHEPSQQRVANLSACGAAFRAFLLGTQPRRFAMHPWVPCPPSPFIALSLPRPLQRNTTAPSRPSSADFRCTRYEGRSPLAANSRSGGGHLLVREGPGKMRWYYTTPETKAVRVRMA